MICDYIILQYCSSKFSFTQWYHANLTGERSEFNAQSQQPEMILVIIVQATKEGRRQCIHLDFETHWQSFEVRNRGYHWPHKMDLGPTKTFLKNSVSIGQL